MQAVYLVQQLARHGTLNEPAAFEASINSIYRKDADSTADVYGGSVGVHTGLNLLRAQLRSFSAPRDLELTRYAIGVLYLERQLARRSHMLNSIATGIDKASAQAEYFSPCHPNLIASLASLYSDTVSTLTPRIMVNGEQRHLANPDNASKIRALLLAAIRSAVLWRQLGGGRLRLLFGRSATLRAIDAALGN